MSRTRSQQQSHDGDLSFFEQQQQELSQQSEGKLTATGLLSKLESLLVAKSNEIQLAGRLGERLLSQQTELETRIRELEDEVNQGNHGLGIHGSRVNNGSGYDNSDEESILGGEVKEKLNALEEDLQQWHRGNDEIYRVVGTPSGTELARQASGASMVRPAISLSPSPLQAVQAESLYLVAAIHTASTCSCRLRSICCSDLRRSSHLLALYVPAATECAAPSE